MSVEQTVSRDGNLFWFTSSYSGSGGGDCVEVAAGADAVHVRDSKNRQGPALTVPTHQWNTFLTHAAKQHS